MTDKINLCSLEEWKKHPKYPSYFSEADHGGFGGPFPPHRWDWFPGSRTEPPGWTSVSDDMLAERGRQWKIDTLKGEIAYAERTLPDLRNPIARWLMQREKRNHERKLAKLLAG